MGENKVYGNQELKATMNLIINGGSAKSLAFEAIKAAKKGEIDIARQKLRSADEQLLKAHKEQTKMLASEKNEQEAVTLLMVHGQNHLMNAITFRDVAGEFVDLYERLLNRD